MTLSLYNSLYDDVREGMEQLETIVNGLGQGCFSAECDRGGSSWVSLLQSVDSLFRTSNLRRSKQRFTRMRMVSTGVQPWRRNGISADLFKR
ncbi:hypothetical protein [Myxacorys almedinensis]|uniref:Uncharacterized protein n=1 Tax=Myxacorys almedinensis A TaxID=2690445 RepID=A0A8J7Z510_9CYAN|nr:hypothetical protein [Myxacorys almedinensis]NDJ18301.1 hypothetical protein [Myxacorys almedinensis A]